MISAVGALPSLPANNNLTCLVRGEAGVDEVLSGKGRDGSTPPVGQDPKLDLRDRLANKQATPAKHGGYVLLLRRLVRNMGNRFGFS